jgi:hypothetical protein
MVTVFVLVTYQHVVAFAYGLKAMPPMDQQCFCGNRKVHLNYMSVSGYDGVVLDEARHRQIWYDIVVKYPKFRYRVVSRFGDLYYEEMSLEMAMERGYHYESDPSKTLKD